LREWKRLLPLQPGSEEREADQHQHIEKQTRKKEDRKNKIYFIWKFGKDAYLCTPNRKEG
jgi:hypothetical protein